ncbi:MAG: hypothetical protein M1812_002487 [Candelaria pacifica]|nr:MAG: hypothetical protein M1812_002487 [Candelaria pacifica]
MPPDDDGASRGIWEEGENKSVGKIGSDLQEAEFLFTTTPERTLSWRIPSSQDTGSILAQDVLAIVEAKVDSTSKIQIQDGRPNTSEIIYNILLLEHHSVDSKVGEEESSSSPIFRSIKVYNLPTAFQNKSQQGARESLKVPSFLRDVQDLHVIISTRAGTGLASSFFESVLQPLLESIGRSQTSYTVHPTESAETISSLTESEFLPLAQKGFKQTIILLTGDGGIADIINGLLSVPLKLEQPPPPGPTTITNPEAEFHIQSTSTTTTSNNNNTNFTKPTIILLPFGTGNALSNSLSPNPSPNSPLLHLLRGTPHPLPLFKATFSPGAKKITPGSSNINSSSRGGNQETNSPPTNSSTHDSNPTPTDTANTNTTTYGAVVFSWGFHATLVSDSDTELYRQHGSKRFQMAAKELLFPSDGSETHQYKAKISLIKKPPSSSSSQTNTVNATEKDFVEENSISPLERPSHFYILATLVSHLEKDLTISPLSKPLDSLLRIIHFAPLSSPSEVMRIMSLAYQGGKHIEEDCVAYEDIEGLKIDFDFRDGETEARWRRVCVDGGIWEVERGGWVDVRKVGRGGEVIDVVYFDES